ncbi:hypothetical protein ACVWZZ_005875 [Bradyrhizobium sp. LM6.10]
MTPCLTSTGDVRSALETSRTAPISISSSAATQISNSKFSPVPPLIRSARLPGRRHHVPAAAQQAGEDSRSITCSPPASLASPEPSQSNFRGGVQPFRKRPGRTGKNSGVQHGNKDFDRDHNRSCCAPAGRTFVTGIGPSTRAEKFDNAASLINRSLCHPGTTSISYRLPRKIFVHLRLRLRFFKLLLGEHRCANDALLHQLSDLGVGDVEEL